MLWIPLAVGLSLVFDPELHPRPLEVAVFAVAIWGAYLIRTMFQESLGMLCFWTTRGAAIFDLYMTAELLLSGRLVPMPLMPDWVETIARFLRSSGRSSSRSRASSATSRTRSSSAAWARSSSGSSIGLAIFRIAWRFAIRRYCSVDG